MIPILGLFGLHGEQGELLNTNFRSQEAEYEKYTEMDDVGRQNYEILNLGNLTDGQRTSLASTGFTYRYILPGWWNNSPKKTIRAQNIDVPLQIQLAVQNLANLVQTDGTNPTATISAISLYFEGRVTTEAERNTTGAIINSPDGQLMQIEDGIAYHMPKIPAGTVQWSTPIDVIKGPVTELDLWFRIFSQVNGGTNNPDYTNFQPSLQPYQISIQTGSEFIVNLTLVSYLQTIAYELGYPSSVMNNHDVKCSFAWFPELRCKLNSGYLDFNFLGKPVINLIWLIATTQDIDLTIVSRCVKFIQQQAGTIRAVTAN